MTSVILLGQSHSGLQRHCGVLGMQKQPASSKHYSMPSSVLNKHARLRNEGFSIGWGSMSWCSALTLKSKSRKKRINENFHTEQLPRKPITSIPEFGEKEAQEGVLIFIFSTFCSEYYIFIIFIGKICPLSLCYVILRNVNFQLNHILSIIIKL